MPQSSTIYIKGATLNLDDIFYAELNRGYTGGELYLEMKGGATFQFYLDIRGQSDHQAYLAIREKCGWVDKGPGTCLTWSAPPGNGE